MSNETTNSTETTAIPAEAVRPESRLTRADVAETSLFAKLVEHHDRGRTTLVRDVVGPGQDPVRLFRGKLRERIFEKCSGRCFYCGHEVAEGETWFGDHVIPHAHGGKTNEWNGVVACFSCNSAKSDKVW